MMHNFLLLINKFKDERSQLKWDYNRINKFWEYSNRTSLPVAKKIIKKTLNLNKYMETIQNMKNLSKIEKEKKV